MQPFRGVLRKVGAIAESANWRFNSAPAPSFIQRYVSARRSYSFALASTDRPWGELWDWETKLGSRQLADRLGVETPTLYREAVSIGELDFSGLPDSFVVKPDRGASAKGVLVLEREGIRYRDVLRQGRILEERTIRSELEELSGEGLISGDRIIVEEALLDESGGPASDWKLYAFQGEIPVIRQIVRYGDERHTTTYDANWNVIRNARLDKREQVLGPPRRPDLLMEVARRVSVELPVPFARVDLYEQGDRVVLGEITPMPGLSGQRFQRRWDVELGKAWERAESRLFIQPPFHWPAGGGAS